MAKFIPEHRRSGTRCAHELTTQEIGRSGKRTGAVRVQNGDRSDAAPAGLANTLREARLAGAVRPLPAVHRVAKTFFIADTQPSAPAPARPKNTITARFKRTTSLSSSCPMRFPSFALVTVVILSTIRRLGSMRPLYALGLTVSLNNGAGVGFVVKGQKVIECSSANLSSCRIATGRDFPV